VQRLHLSDVRSTAMVSCRAGIPTGSHCQALLNNPPLLLLDEPTNGLTRARSLRCVH